jgi:hypothetical protein
VRPERAEGHAKKREERADQQKGFVHAGIVAGEAAAKMTKNCPVYRAKYAIKADT